MITYKCKLNAEVFAVPELPPLPRSELEVARIVWKLKKATVRDVVDVLLPDRPVDFSTVQTYLRRLENGFYQQNRGFVDPDHWQTTERHMVSFMSHPAALHCWSGRRSLFSDRFVEFVERHISDEPAA